MTCSRCGTAILSPEQFELGLCAGCITGSSLYALVALAAIAAQTEPRTKWQYAGKVGDTLTVKGPFRFPTETT